MTVRIVNPGAFRVIADAGMQHAFETIDRITAKGQELISERLRTGVDAAGHVGREDTGAAGQALGHVLAKRVGSKVRGTVEVSPPADEYWPVIEDGRQPNRPISAEGMLRLERWVRRKLGPKAAESLIRGLTQRVASKRLAVAGAGGDLRRVTKDDREAAIRSLTYLVARKIRTKGTPGLHPFRKAADALRGGEAGRIARQVALEIKARGPRRRPGA